MELLECPRFEGWMWAARTAWDCIGMSPRMLVVQAAYVNRACLKQTPFLLLWLTTTSSTARKRLATHGQRKPGARAAHPVHEVAALDTPEMLLIFLNNMLSSPRLVFWRVSGLSQYLELMGNKSPLHIGVHIKLRFQKLAFKTKFWRSWGIYIGSGLWNLRQSLGFLFCLSTCYKRFFLAGEAGNFCMPTRFRSTSANSILLHIKNIYIAF